MGDVTEIEVPEMLHVTDAEPQPAPDRELTPREQLMAQIAANAEAHREAEIARMAGEVAGAAAPEPEPEPAPPELPPAPEAPQPGSYQIDVGGLPVSLTAEEMVRLAQFGAYAGIGALQQPQPVATAPMPQPLALDDAVLAGTVNKIQFGAPEEGQAALRGLIGHVLQVAPGPRMDPNAIAAEATQRALAHTRLLNDAEVIRSEFPRIFTDQRIANMAHQTVTALRQQDALRGPQRPDLEIYREAGNQIYNLIGEPRPEGGRASRPGDLAVRRGAGIEERKRSAPSRPAGVDRRAGMPEMAPRRTGSDIVAEMRRARGQPT